MNIVHVTRIWQFKQQHGVQLGGNNVGIQHLKDDAISMINQLELELSHQTNQFHQ